jgi:hypothetical protein
MDRNGDRISSKTTHKHTYRPIDKGTKRQRPL